MAAKRIARAIRRKRALTRKAKAAGKTVSEYTKSPPKNISRQTKRQTNLAKTLIRLARRRKRKGAT